MLWTQLGYRTYGSCWKAVGVIADNLLVNQFWLTLRARGRYVNLAQDLTYIKYDGRLEFEELQ